MSDPQPFQIPDTDLDNLRRRLKATRWPDPQPVGDWSQGFAYLQEVCAYWGEKYDWRARGAHLNSLAQFKTDVNDVNIHFIHVRSPEPNALPLVMTHGWPGSIVEFHWLEEAETPCADQSPHRPDPTLPP